MTEAEWDALRPGMHVRRKNDPCRATFCIRQVTLGDWIPRVQSIVFAKSGSTCISRGERKRWEYVVPVALDDSDDEMW